MSILFFHNLCITIQKSVRLLKIYYNIIFRISILTNNKRYDIINIFTKGLHRRVADLEGDPKLFAEGKNSGKEKI